MNWNVLTHIPHEGWALVTWPRLRGATVGDFTGGSVLLPESVSIVELLQNSGLRIGKNQGFLMFPADSFNRSFSGRCLPLSTVGGAELR